MYVEGVRETGRMEEAAATRHTHPSLLELCAVRNGRMAQEALGAWMQDDDACKMVMVMMMMMMVMMPSLLAPCLPSLHHA
jgi:hypothetical protein